VKRVTVITSTITIAGNRAGRKPKETAPSGQGSEPS
jgi:hypothetical protein